MLRSQEFAEMDKLTWQDELLELEKTSQLSPAKRYRVGKRFLKNEARPLLERTADALSVHGFDPAITPRAESVSERLMLEVRTGPGRANPACSPTAFRVVISPQGEMVIDYQKPFNDNEHFADLFGFLSGEQFHEGLRAFLNDNGLPDETT